jgi:hypothetical protein
MEGKPSRRANVFIPMSRNARRFVTGETVTLLAEIHAADRIHEIGTRARVLEDHGAVVVLHFLGAEAEIATCPSDHVAPAVPSRARAQRPAAPFRPAIA